MWGREAPCSCCRLAAVGRRLTRSLSPFPPPPNTDVAADHHDEEDEEDEEPHGGESAQPGYEGEAFDYCGQGGGPYAPLLNLRGGKQRMGPRERARAAADKAERLGGCPLRSQYGSPLCVVM